ncbi:ABC-three component system middle component 6 [Paenibacillus xylanexedens]|uniref:ABC-three component system middle component 6 n=1 Tax=Paenibacillus xylanexedens TaxID=528191 RepID=UPI0037C8F512
MIINLDREPKYSLYYIGGLILEILSKHISISIDDLYSKVKTKVDKNLYIDFIYYSLDWLFLLSLVEIEEDKVTLC